jgi:hypothetical protein
MSRPSRPPIQANPPSEISTRSRQFLASDPSPLRAPAPQNPSRLRLKGSTRFPIESSAATLYLEQTRPPLQPYAEKVAVHETLHALNRYFEQVLAKMDKMRLFRPDLSKIFWIRTQELRTHVTYEVLEVMHEVEQEDWAIYGRLHRQREKKYDNRDDDILLQAEKIKEQRRKEAKKKPKRKKGA